MLAWRPVLTELSTYCKSRLCIRNMEDGGQSHISGYTGKKEVIWNSYHEFTKPKSCLTKLIAFYDK